MSITRILAVGAAFVAVGAAAQQTVMNVTPPPSNFFAQKSYLSPSDIPDGTAILPALAEPEE